MSLSSNSGDRVPRGARSDSKRLHRGTQASPPDRNRVEFLTDQVKLQPRIRPEVMSRARALAADPNYPSMTTLLSVAKQILASPDFSEDEAGLN